MPGTNQQSDLFRARQERALARKNDPPTAKEAAFASGRDRGSLAIALKWLRKFPGGATYREIAAAARDEIEDRNFFSRRLPTLRDLGLARLGPDRECSIAHRRMQVWFPVEGGTGVRLQPAAVRESERQDQAPRRRDCTHLGCSRFGRVGPCLYGDPDDAASASERAG